jgi:hypothetical protein
MMKLILLILSASFVGCVNQRSNQVVRKDKKLNTVVIDSLVLVQRTLLKDFAFCSCLSWASKDPRNMDSGGDDVSQSVYYDSMLYHDSIITFIGKLARRAADEMPVFSVGDLKGRKAKFVSCNLFAKTVYLDSLINSYDSYIFRP